MISWIDTVSNNKLNDYNVTEEFLKAQFYARTGVNTNDVNIAAAYLDGIGLPLGTPTEIAQLFSASSTKRKAKEVAEDSLLTTKRPKQLKQVDLPQLRVLKPPDLQPTSLYSWHPDITDTWVDHTGRSYESTTCTERRIPLSNDESINTHKYILSANGTDNNAYCPTNAAFPEHKAVYPRPPNFKSAPSVDYTLPGATTAQKATTKAATKKQTTEINELYSEIRKRAFNLNESTKEADSFHGELLTLFDLIINKAQDLDTVKGYLKLILPDSFDEIANGIGPSPPPFVTEETHTLLDSFSNYNFPHLIRLQADFSLLIDQQVKAHREALTIATGNVKSLELVEGQRPSIDPSDLEIIAQNIAYATTVTAKVAKNANSSAATTSPAGQNKNAQLEKQLKQAKLQLKTARYKNKFPRHNTSQDPQDTDQPASTSATGRGQQTNRGRGGRSARGRGRGQSGRGNQPQVLTIEAE